MAFQLQTGTNGLKVWKETISALPSDTTETFSSVIRGVGPDNSKEKNYISILGVASAVAGTNIDIALYGCMNESGTNKFLLLDAPIADITNAAKVKAGVVDLNAYPAPFYFISFICDADNSANNLQLFVAKS